MADEKSDSDSLVFIKTACERFALTKLAPLQLTLTKDVSSKFAPQNMEFLSLIGRIRAPCLSNSA
jgi:hypothetical protein